MKAFIIRRVAIGDVLFAEPTIRALGAIGYDQIFISTRYPEIFKNHPLVTGFREEKPSNSRTFNLTDAYEASKGLAIRSYLIKFRLHLPELELTPRIFLSSKEKKYGFSILHPDEKWVGVDTGKRPPKIPRKKQSWSKDEWQPILQIIKGAGYKLVIVGNKGHDIPPLDNQDLDLRDQTTLRQLMSIINAANMFLGVDSAPLHIANSLGTDSIGLFGDVSPNSRIPPFSKIIPVRVNEQLNPKPILEAFQKLNHCENDI